MLNPQTPFDINREITDLPIGQLAAAQITHYNNQGCSIGGNIFIEPTANVKGWLLTSPLSIIANLANNIKINYINKNKPLVLLPEWSTRNESIIPDSGFSEAAADTFVE